MLECKCNHSGNGFGKGQAIVKIVATFMNS